MKHVLLMAMALTFLACDSEKINLSEVVESGDVLSISASKTSESGYTYSFEAKIPVFDSIADTSLLKSIYAPMKLEIDDYSRNGLKKALIRLKNSYFFGRLNGEELFEMKIISKKDNFLAISYKYNDRSKSSQERGFLTLKNRVFDTKNNKPILLEDIVKNPNDKAWDKILRDNISAQDKEEARGVAIYPNDDFYLEEKGICFDFKYFIIRVPFDKKVEALLTPDFAKLASQTVDCANPHFKIQLKDPKNDFSLTLVLCDEKMESGYAIHDGQTERMPLKLQSKGTYDEMHNGEANAQYVLNIQGDAIMGAYYFLKKSNKRTYLEEAKKDFDSLAYGGQTYKTITIGSQTWMAENLNYEAEGSKCYGDNPANCKKYGRMYNWRTAMKVCPSGWHLPSEAECNELINFAGGKEIAGKHLKARSGWSENGNGSDEYRFAALPGGYGGSGGPYNYAGSLGYWWSSDDSGLEDKGHVYSMAIFTSDGAEMRLGSDGYLHSVRCVKD